MEYLNRGQVRNEHSRVKQMIMKKILVAIGFMALAGMSIAQHKTENIVVVTMDGLRWQEVFEGADSLLAFDTAATYSDEYVQKKFWASTANERRKKLMPFFWTELEKNGVLLGNRNFGNYVNNANPYWFSYPGYNEIFTGYPDTMVNSNDKIWQHGIKQNTRNTWNGVFTSWLLKIRPAS